MTETQLASCLSSIIHTYVPSETQAEAYQMADEILELFKSGNSALKPCPFCGGRATFQYRIGKNGSFLLVQCDACSASSKGVPVHAEIADHEKLISLWNMRTENG